uniref:Uncharacterized protein n=1 Tax=Neisseria meningitidis alpha275 TaxID=295996 RepID=C6SN98_NEIME|nr:hypothetical protein predicted by Glimmer/Critica [Neisseria meningitidis alpha275]
MSYTKFLSLIKNIMQFLKQYLLITVNMVKASNCDK